MSAPAGVLVLRMTASEAGAGARRRRLASQLQSRPYVVGDGRRTAAAGPGRCRSTASRRTGADPVLRRRGSRDGSGDRAAGRDRRRDDRATESGLTIDGGHRDHPDPLHRDRVRRPVDRADPDGGGVLGRRRSDSARGARSRVRRTRGRSSPRITGDCSAARRSSWPGSAEQAELPTDVRVARAVDVDDPALAALVFNYGRYLMIASSRPGGLPTNLQGIWNDILRPPWSSNFTVNINTEMNYWPAETTNLSECHEPLLDFLGHLAEAGRRTAQRALRLRRLDRAPQRRRVVLDASRSRVTRGGRTGRWPAPGWSATCGTTTSSPAIWSSSAGRGRCCEAPRSSASTGWSSCRTAVSVRRRRRRRRTTTSPTTGSPRRSPCRRRWTWR